MDLRDGGAIRALAVRRRHGGAAVPVHGGHDAGLPDGQPGAPRTRPLAPLADLAAAARATSWASRSPSASPTGRAACRTRARTELTKVDILNCMGVGMAVLAVAAVFRSDARVRFAVIAGLAIAAAAPADDQSAVGRRSGAAAGVPGAGGGARAGFRSFPASPTSRSDRPSAPMVKRAAAERFDRLMQWSMLDRL